MPPYMDRYKQAILLGLVCTHFSSYSKLCVRRSITSDSVAVDGGGGCDGCCGALAIAVGVAGSFSGDAGSAETIERNAISVICLDVCVYDLLR